MNDEIDAMILELLTTASLPETTPKELATINKKIELLQKNRI